MTNYSHAKICLVVSVLSLIILVFCVNQDVSAVTSPNYLIYAAVSFAGGFLIREYTMRQDLNQPDGNERLDDLPPVLRTAALMTIWIPVALAAAAVFLMFQWSIPPQKISWILIVIAGMCGQHLSSVAKLYTKQ
jgi:hypothetical protein